MKTLQPGMSQSTRLLLEVLSSLIWITSHLMSCGRSVKEGPLCVSLLPDKVKKTNTLRASLHSVWIRKVHLITYTLCGAEGILRAVSADETAVPDLRPTCNAGALECNRRVRAVFAAQLMRSSESNVRELRQGYAWMRHGRFEQPIA